MICVNRTELVRLHQLHGVNPGQRLNSSLDPRPLVPAALVHALDHLLLLIDPVQVLSQHGQADRLQDVGVLEDDPIGSWSRNKETERSRSGQENNR